MPAIQSIQCRNILSFNDSSPALNLGPLNVLIGPNGSGKSNLLEVIGLLQSAPRELVLPVREGGGVKDWLWKGAPSGSSATVQVDIAYPNGPLRYRLSFKEAGQKLHITDERIESTRPPKAGQRKPYFFFGYESGHPTLNVKGVERRLQIEEINPQLSVLSQRQDPDQYPEVTFVGRLFRSFRLYREWNLGRYTPPRIPQPADLPNEHLDEDCRNLGLVLNRLRRDGNVKQRLLETLGKFYQGARDIDVSVQGGTVQIFLDEKTDGRPYSIPATRLSDGTLRWIALLTTLLHPAPPPLTCIEEPELGLHPDVMPILADLLREASTRTQLIVTTHSDALIDALSEVPESVIVCEKSDGATSLHRLQSESLADWLKKYSLGQLWRKGEIGGNRY